MYTWLSIGNLRVHLGFLADPLSVTWILLVTGVGSLIHLYAIGYMHGDERYSRFFAYFNLFATAMLVLVLASSFLLTFLGWEGVGLCSYLLIGFWYERPRASSASLKAFVTNRVGDFGFMIAMFFIVGSLGSLDYAAMGQASGMTKSTATAIALLLFVGCIGKSAQIGLHVWLPDAMEGPTPVSALIHAATMVTAGVFLVCRAHPFFERSGTAMDVVAIVGALTAFLAGTVALVQPDIKRVLAYSTVSQLGYMFLAAGVGAYSIAVFFVLAHACYKATLFLGSGTVIHGTGDTQDIRIMGGLRRFMPFTAGAFIVAWLTIAGLPPFSGFWAKDGVLAAAFFHHDYGVWIIGLLAAGLTGFYMTRETLLVFGGPERFRVAVAAGTEGDAPVGEHDHAHASTEHDVTASPTVDYGTPPVPAHLHARPPRGHRHDGAAGGGPRGPRRGRRGARAAVQGPRVPLGLARADLRRRQGRGTVVVPRRVRSVDARGGGRPRPASRSRCGSTGVGSPTRPSIPVTSASAASGVSSATPGTTTRGSRRSSVVPSDAAARWTADVLDEKVIDGAVNGIARAFAAAGTGLRRVQTGLVRQYALGHRRGHGRAARLGGLAGGDRVRGYPILTAIIVDADARRAPGPAHPVAPARARPRRRLPGVRGHARLRAAAPLELPDRTSAASSSPSTTGGSTRSVSATSSASTASACS